MAVLWSTFESSARNYRDTLVDMDVMRPALADSFSDDMREEVWTRAYADYNDRDTLPVSWVKVGDKKSEKWEMGSEESVMYILNDTAKVLSGYYFDGGRWFKHTLELARDVLERLEMGDWSDDNTNSKGGANSLQKAPVASYYVLESIVLIKRYEPGFEVNTLKNLGAFTMKGSDKWPETWAEFLSEMERALGVDDDDDGIDPEESEARDVLGVAEDAGEDAVMDAYRE